MFHSEENGSKGMDPLVLIDAIAICMAYEEKELCKIGEVALAVIFDVASIILGSKERVGLANRDRAEVVCVAMVTPSAPPPGLPAAPVLLHRGAPVRLLLRAGLVRQAGRRRVHQVPDGAAASHLGSAEPAHLPQSAPLRHDGPHWRGGIITKLQLPVT